MHRSYVVTAAHCVDQVQPKLLVAGDQNSAMLDARTEQHLHIDSVFIHPKYNRSLRINDIAVIKLKDPVEWTKWVQPICLPGSTENLKENSSTYMQLVGWGYDHWNSGGEKTEELHAVELPIVSNEQCQYWMTKLEITDNHLCAGHKEGKKDGCYVRMNLFSGTYSRSLVFLVNALFISGKIQIHVLGPFQNVRIFYFIRPIPKYS